MVYPPAGKRRDGKHDRDDQDVFAICDSQDGSKEHQRKQRLYNKFATFDCFDKRGTGKEESEGDQKMHRGKATES